MYRRGVGGAIITKSNTALRYRRQNGYLVKQGLVIYDSFGRISVIFSTFTNQKHGT